jgi:hypothetical protein
MKSPMIVKPLLWQAWPWHLLMPIIFLAFLWQGEVYAQNQGVYNQINDLLTQSSMVQDSIRREISRISYLITSSANNPNFYLNPNWQSSFIITNEERVYHFSGRMNALDNSIEVKLGEEIRTIHPDQLKLVVIGRRTFMPFKGSVIDFTDQRNVYLEVLSHGKVHLLVHYFYRSQSGVNNRLSPNTNGGNFKILPIYYCIRNGGNLTRLRTSKRKILALFKDQQDQVESYAKDHHLRFSGENDLIRIFDYFNSLDQ